MNFQKLDLNLLVALDALLEEQHVGRAALRLHVSQPTMSLALARLREHYKDELLIRDGRNMAATAFAAGLKPQLRQFMAQTRDLASAGSDFDFGKSDRRFVLVMGEGLARVYVPGLLKRMREASPSTTLTCLGITDTAIRLFNAGGVDLLTVPSGAWLTDDDRSWMERQPSELLSKEERVCLAWRGNRIVGDPASLDEIRRAGLVIPSFISHDSRPPADRPLGRYYGSELNVAAEMPASAIGPALVGTDLVALISRRQAEFDAARFDLKVLALCPELQGGTELRMFWHRRSAGDRAVDWLKALLREEIASWAPKGA